MTPFFEIGALFISVVFGFLLPCGVIRVHYDKVSEALLNAVVLVFFHAWCGASLYSEVFASRQRFGMNAVSVVADVVAQQFGIMLFCYYTGAHVCASPLMRAAAVV